MKARILIGLAAAACLAMAALFAGCSKPNQGRVAKPSGAKRYTIGFAMTLTDPYWQNMRLGALDEGKKDNADVIILNAEEDVQKQGQQVNDLIARRVDIVCLVPMKPDALVNSVRALNEARIPVIIVNREIGPGCDCVAYTGTDTYQGGVVSAEILMKAIGGRGKIVEFQQVLGTGPQLARTKALQDVMRKYPGVDLVAQIPHEGDNAKVVSEMGALLSKYPDLKGVYVHGDPQALAAGNACTNAGRRDIKIVGMGGSEQAIEAIKEGRLTGTSYQKPEEEGRSGIRLAVEYLKNGSLPKKRYPIRCEPIVKENASQFKGQF